MSQGESANFTSMNRIALLLVLGLACCIGPAQPDSEVPAKSIYWSDGDNGRIDGVKFRLANIDAPETGGVGSRGGAKCEAERELGYKAKAFMVEITKSAELVITERFGTDRYQREVILLEANGEDVAQRGIAAGHLAPWPHKGRRALAKKPDWCSRNNSE